jgi:hypothetical protein
MPPFPVPTGTKKFCKWMRPKPSSLPSAATQSPFQPVEVQPKPDGWIAITVPPELFTAKTDRFHARETGQFAPYLAVQGTK